MARINDHYLKLKSQLSLQRDRPARVTAFQAAHPDAEAHPPGHRRRDAAAARGRDPRAARGRRRDGAAARRSAAIGPEPGYDFLTELIARTTTASRGVKIAADEIFVSDGAKSDTGNIQEIFGAGLRRGAHRSRLSRLRRQQRDGRAHRHRRREPAATTGSSTCRARRRTASSRALPDRPVDLDLPLLSEQSDRRGDDARGAQARGSTTRASTGPSSSTTPRTRRTSATPTSRTRSTRSRARARWRSSSGASRRPPASRARAARSRSCPRSSRAGRPRASR